MKVFDVRTRVGGSGEYILGVDDTGSHACYLIYGVMKPGEKGRALKPGKGHEELILATKGDFLVSGHMEGELKQGQAIYLKGEQMCSLENAAGQEALYVISGGHSDSAHH